jgi:hypothetical protein
MIAGKRFSRSVQVENFHDRSLVWVSCIPRNVLVIGMRKARTASAHLLAWDPSIAIQTLIRRNRMMIQVKQLIADPFLMLPMDAMNDNAGKKVKREKRKNRNWRPTWCGGRR